MNDCWLCSGIGKVATDIQTGETFGAVPEIDWSKKDHIIRKCPVCQKERMFPIQDGPDIPWSVAEIAYKEYSKRYGTSQSLERLAQRGGFGIGELKDLYPDYEIQVHRITELTEEIAVLRFALEMNDQSFNRLLKACEDHEKEKEELTKRLMELEKLKDYIDLHLPDLSKKFVSETTPSPTPKEK